MAEYHFETKVALVTGAGKGIGRTIAKTLSATGAVTYALARNKEQLETLVAECPNIRPVCVDLSDWESTRKVVEELGPIDLLVNNAAIFNTTPFLEVNAEQVDSIMNTNVKAVINISQIVAKSLIDRKSPGAIVNISSIFSLRASDGHSVFGASKGALDTLSLVMATELGPHQIRVNTLNPGLVITEYVQEMGAEFTENIRQLTPLGRVCEKEDIANAVLFLLSDNARMINGANLVIDGGMIIKYAD